jgi:hypothetical protein
VAAVVLLLLVKRSLAAFADAFRQPWWMLLGA